MSAHLVHRVLVQCYGVTLFLVAAMLLPLTVLAENQGRFDVPTVKFNAGCFMLGSEKYYPEEGPLTNECVGAFSLMTTEVTHVQFAEFVRLTGYKTRAERGWSASDPDGPGVDLPPGSAVFLPDPKTRPSNLNWWKFVEGADWKHPLGSENPYRPHPQSPVVHVTRSDAAAFAEWAGGRLPSEAEWEYAARHTLDGGELKSASKSDATSLSANTWQGVFPIVNTNDDGYEGVAPVGSFSPDANGVFDLIGNVWEWTSAPYASNHSERARAQAGRAGYDASQPGVPVGTIKGGSFLCAQSYCFRFRPTARQSQDLAFGTSHIGFRVVFDEAVD